MTSSALPDRRRQERSRRDPQGDPPGPTPTAAAWSPHRPACSWSEKQYAEILADVDSGTAPHKAKVKRDLAVAKSKSRGQAHHGARVPASWVGGPGETVEVPEMTARGRRS